MPGWKYQLWTEKEIAKFGLKNKKLYRRFMAEKYYHGASDVVRIEVLERLGGIYIDADTERLASIDDAPFMQADFFAVEANKPHGVPAGMQRIANGVMGSVPGHPILKAYIAAMGKAKQVRPAWSTIGGTMLTMIVAKHRTPGTMILEPHTFYPHDKKGEPSRTTGKSYAHHVWGTTHGLYGTGKI